MASADLSLRPVGEGADVRRIFSGQAATSPTRVLSGTLVHVLAVAALLLAARLVPVRVYSTILPERMPADLVYLVDPGAMATGDRRELAADLIKWGTACCHLGRNVE